MPQLAEHPNPRPRPIFFRSTGNDHVEFYVGNARQSAHYYRSAFGMTLTGYSGPETGVRDRASYVLEQDKIRFVLTTPLRPDHPIAEHIATHGDGVRDIALTVDDAESAYRETTKRGARGVREPFTVSDENGEVRMSSIAAYGDTLHTFVERRNYRGVFLPEIRCRGRHRQNLASRWIEVRRSHGRQRRLEPDEHLGQVLRRRDGLQALSDLRR